MAARDAIPTAGPDPGVAGTVVGDPRRWLILAIVAVGYLMVTLDLTVMNLALPSAQPGQPHVRAMERVTGADDIRRLLASPSVVVGSAAAHQLPSGRREAIGF